MNWTKGPPTTPGWYFACIRQGELAGVYICQRRVDLEDADHGTSEWPLETIRPRSLAWNAQFDEWWPQAITLPQMGDANGHVHDYTTATSMLDRWCTCGKKWNPNEKEIS